MSSSSDQSWDLIIKPNRAWWDIGLRDVWEYRDLLLLFVKRDIIAFYKQTVLGPVWFFLQPLFTMGVYLFVFGNLAGLSTAGLPGPIFYLVGITFWTYFSQTLLKAANTLKENETIFGKVYFPRIIMPLSVILSNMFRLGIQLVLLLCVVIYYVFVGEFEFKFTWYFLLFPCLLFLLACQAFGLGLIVSAMTTKYRDLALLLAFGIQLLMYATPVVYPLSSLQGSRMFDLVAVNPTSFLFEGIRYSLFQAGEFSSMFFLISVLMTFVIVFSGVIIFNRVERNFVDTI